MSTEQKNQTTSSTPGTPTVPDPTKTNTSARSKSPATLSPTCNSRLLEKAELQNLNDRLACYIDRVRDLETANARLNSEVDTIKDSVGRETFNLKSMYEKEIADSRKLLDETAKQKAKLEIDLKRFWDVNDEVKSKLDKKNKELLIVEENLKVFASHNNELIGKYNFTCGKLNHATIKLKDLQNENKHLQKQSDECRKHLEAETLARVDVENAFQSLHEELSFREEIYKKDLDDLRAGCQIQSSSSIDGHLNERYEAKLQQSLRELREQYELQMLNNREEIEKLNESKINNLRNIADRSGKVISNITEDLNKAYNHIDGLNSHINDLFKSNTVLNARIQELEQLSETERARNSENVKSLDNDLENLRNEMAKQLQDYQDLMDIKVSLDLEIAAYDKLLKNEEHRLNIVPESDKNAAVSSFSQLLISNHSTPRALKRKHKVIDNSNEKYTVTGSAKGDIEISEVDPKGYFIKLHNKGKIGINIGNWKLISNAEGSKISIIFHESIEINAGGAVTVWSGKAGIKHDPPKNIVIREHWLVNDNTKTKLVNDAGEEVAGMECRKLEHSNAESSSTTNKKRSGLSRFIPFFQK